MNTAIVFINTVVDQVGEVAEAVAFLASPAAAYITGHVLRVNGGLNI